MLPPQTIYKFTEFEIKDKYGQVWYPISAVSDSSFTLYLVSKFDKGYKNTLVSKLFRLLVFIHTF